jgi:cephalosporin hydroxylase
MEKEKETLVVLGFKDPDHPHEDRPAVFRLAMDRVPTIGEYLTFEGGLDEGMPHELQMSVIGVTTKFAFGASHTDFTQRIEIDAVANGRIRPMELAELLLMHGAVEWVDLNDFCGQRRAKREGQA